VAGTVNAAIASTTSKFIRASSDQVSHGQNTANDDQARDESTDDKRPQR
jgi:hypothetical protein